MVQITFEVRAEITGIRIDTTGPRLILAGVLVNSANGERLREFVEDVTPDLTAAQLARVTAIATQAQAWADAKLTP